MSSPSPRTSAYDLVVVGRGWNSFAAALILQQTGIRIAVLNLSETPLGWIPVSIGSGEPKSVVEKIMGQPLTRILWELSQKSFERFRDLLKNAGLLVEEGTNWYDGGKDTDFQREDGLRFDERAFVEFGSARVGAYEVRSLSIENDGPLEQRVKFQTTGGKLLDVKTTFVLLLDEPTAIRLYPGLSDKLIPITLSSFTFPARISARFSLALFNKGADYVVHEGNQLRLGSFRNLFEDKAAGYPLATDPVTLRSVTRFFGDRGWIAPDTIPVSHTSLAAISCDGLPIVGALAEAPRVFIAAGFSARSQNFLGEVAWQLGNALGERTSFAALEKFSTKRFVI